MPHMSQIIKVGTRKSPLAIWQATYVSDLLKQKGFNTKLVFIQSNGETDLTSPLYELGIQGIFTRTLDQALLDHQIDIAVHSLKDVPTQLAKGISLAATPERGNPYDVLVSKQTSRLPEDCEDYTIATSSLRRRAQWINRYPTHRSAVLRGNINTRLEKLLSTSNWDGALFAAAGIERIDLKTPHQVTLDWMLPAPAQGALGVMCREVDGAIKEICLDFHHEDTMLATSAERIFLKTLMGGCSMPIAAYAKVLDGQLHFHGNILTVDGSKKAEVHIKVTKEEAQRGGVEAARQLLDNGGEAIIDSFYESRGK